MEILSTIVPLGNYIQNDKLQFLICSFYKCKIRSDYHCGNDNIKIKLCFSQAHVCTVNKDYTE